MYSHKNLRRLLLIPVILLSGSALHAITLGHENKEDLPSTNHATKALAASRGGPDVGGYVFIDSTATVREFGCPLTAGKWMSLDKHFWMGGVNPKQCSCGAFYKSSIFDVLS